jgi:hypothetical protein
LLILSVFFPLPSQVGYHPEGSTDWVVGEVCNVRKDPAGFTYDVKTKEDNTDASIEHAVDRGRLVNRYTCDGRHAGEPGEENLSGKLCRDGFAWANWNCSGAKKEGGLGREQVRRREGLGESR